MRRSVAASSLVDTPSDLALCTATQLLALYAGKAASPMEAVSAVLERIVRFE